MSFFALLFAFVLGGVVALAGAVFALAKAFSVAEDRLLPPRHARGQGNAARTTAVFRPSEESSLRPESSKAPAEGAAAAPAGLDMVGKPAPAAADREAPVTAEIRLTLPSDVDLQYTARRWLFCVLNSNFLFCYESRQRGGGSGSGGQKPGGKQDWNSDAAGGASSSVSSPSSRNVKGTGSELPTEPPVAVIHLDSISVDVSKRKAPREKVLVPNGPLVKLPGRPVWGGNSKKHFLLLKSETRELWEGSKVVRLHFREGRDEEAWFLRFQRAASLHGRTAGGAAERGSDANDDAEDATAAAAEARETVTRMEAQWAALAAELTNREPVVNPDAASAIANRIFWSLAQSAHFGEFIRYKIRKELEVASLPPGLRSIDLVELNVGDRLPVIRQLALSRMDPDGAMTVDADVTYPGGAYAALVVVLAIKKPLAVLASPLKRFRKSTNDAAEEDRVEDCYLIPVRVRANVNSVVGKFRWQANAPPAECFWIGFLEPPDADIDVHYEVGGDAHKFTHIQGPRIAQLAAAGLRRAITELLVYPHMEDVQFPKFPHKKKVDDYIRRRDGGGVDEGSDGQRPGSAPADSAITADIDGQSAAPAPGEDLDAALDAAFGGSGGSLHIGKMDEHVDDLMARQKARVEGKKNV